MLWTVIGGSLTAGIGVFMKYQMTPHAIGEAVVWMGFMICLAPLFARNAGKDAVLSLTKNRKWMLASIAFVGMIIAGILLAMTTKA